MKAQIRPITCSGKVPKEAGWREGSLIIYIGSLRVGLIEPIKEGERSEDDESGELFRFHSSVDYVEIGGRLHMSLQGWKDEIELTMKEYAAKFIR